MAAVSVVRHPVSRGNKQHSRVIFQKRNLLLQMTWLCSRSSGAALMVSLQLATNSSDIFSCHGHVHPSESAGPYSPRCTPGRQQNLLLIWALLRPFISGMRLEWQLSAWCVLPQEPKALCSLLHGRKYKVTQFVFYFECP